ncbi:flagellar filament capping protein FliD [Bacillus massilinigeriensis]|uniref:flagellar filament capping protein FliD n=1 Tax=Bacillus massilionigeriensis TaxID=1805475 RepID=UPI00096B03B7|nr:flagellar filament capping protein FliD [Bacillus massilionigeriensis]
MRIGGLASGMDIDTMVSELMKAQRTGLDKLKQKKQIIEWQRDDYRSMNTLLLDFRAELTQMKLTSKYRSRQTASTDESKLTAVASSGASVSSYTISNVTQLASAETKVNGGKIYNTELDTSKSLYSQKDNFTYPGTNVWRDGAVLSKNITTTADGKIVSFGDMSNIKTDELSSWSVQVNGIGFDAVTDYPRDPSNNPLPLKENQVLIKADGSMEFGKSLAKDSVVNINYVAKNRTENLTLSKDTKTWQLSQGAINTISTFTLTEKDKDGNVVGTAPTFIIDGNNIKKEKDDGSYEVVGTVDKNTGLITFNEKMPLPAEGAETITSVSIAYDHKFTNFSMDTYTSKGERHADFLISGSESLNNVINRVNSSSVGANMFYDSHTGQLSLTRTETGDFNKNGQEIFTNGSFINDVLRFKGATIKVEGKNAKLSINGLATERTSNTFEMNGVTFTVKQEFTNPVSISISNKAEDVFNNIKDFVTKYNELIDKINKKTSETRYRDYTPLTDDQREELSDKQQELWEEKARSGLLKNDTILSSVLYGMRTNFSQSVTNDKTAAAFNQLSKIGIKTTANYLEGGKLEIDEAALKKAIEADPDSVENLFRGDGITTSQKGIVQRLYETVSGTMDKLKLKAGNSFSVNDTFTLGKQLDNVDDQIDRFEDKLEMLEDRYWRQFTAMEQAIQRSNSQSMYLSNYFSS